MTPEQRYLLDINGYLLIPDAVEPPALAAARDAAYGATERGQKWDLYSDLALSALAFTPATWPVVLELTRNKPMVRLSAGIHDAPFSGGGGMLHCNREVQRSSTIGSPSMASYSVVGGKPIMADFGMFVYLDTVHPGDGGLLLVHGSHKASFERPPSIGGTYGSASAGRWPIIHQAGERERGGGVGRAALPHPAGVIPAHCVNICPRAGDVVIMSECVAHASLAWHGAGHRHVLRIGLKPQWLGRPEDNLEDEQILRMPPELRELRRHAPLSYTKSIAQPGRGGAVRLSPPGRTPPPVTDDERTHGAPYHVAGPGDAELIESTPTTLLPALPPVPGGMTDEQRYIFDIHGYCHLHNAVSGAELRECQAAAMEYVTAATTSGKQLPPGFTQTPGGKFLHAHAWSPCLERLATVRRLSESAPGEGRMID
eukprot:COSAG01_NODE_6286_length_3753_cov_2.422003_1_plen_427_part_00